MSPAYQIVMMIQTKLYHSHIGALIKVHVQITFGTSHETVRRTSYIRWLQCQMYYYKKESSYFVHDLHKILGQPDIELYTKSPIFHMIHFCFMSTTLFSPTLCSAEVMRKIHVFFWYRITDKMWRSKFVWIWTFNMRSVHIMGMGWSYYLHVVQVQNVPLFK